MPNTFVQIKLQQQTIQQSVQYMGNRGKQSSLVPHKT